MRGVMFLRHTKRKKVQRPLLYLGEINDSQERIPPRAAAFSGLAE